MFERVRSDESLQVLLFICLPLLLLLVAGIIFRIRHTPKTTARFASFTVTVVDLGREGGYVEYKDSHRRLEFWALPCNRRKQLLALQLPESVPDADVTAVVQNLSRGLTELGFERYEISRKGDSTVLATASKA